MPTPAQIAAFNANLAKLNANVPNNSLPAGFSAAAISPSNPDGQVGYDAPTYSGTTYASGGAGGAVDPNTLAQYDQEIGNVNSAINRLPGQLATGNKNIDTAYNSSYDTLQGQKATGQRDYNTNKNTTAQNFVQAKNTIGSQAGNSLNSLLRLLGARGAGGSLAATQVAPTAVARNATLQRTGEGNTFAQNNQNLDTQWNDFLTGWNTDLQDIGRQRTDSQHSLQAKIDQTKAQLLQNLATLQGQRTDAAGGNAVSAAQPYLDQANSLLSQADSLGTETPVYKTAPHVYTAPNLASYTVNPNAAPVMGNGDSGSLDMLTPYLSLLMGKKQQPNLSASF